MSDLQRESYVDKRQRERPAERLKRYLEIPIEQDAEDFDMVSFDDEELTKFLR